jgi:uncharacterized protein (TIGR03435 family)
MTSRLNRVCLVLVMLYAVTPLAAQTPDGPSFDVASVRKSAPDAAGGGSRMQPGGSYRAGNLTLQQLVAIAYNVPTTRIVGGPPWATSDRFDIIAKASDSATTRDIPRLLQELLRQRFKLRVSPEKRPLPVYSLIVARDDRRLGPQMRLTSANCDDPEVRRSAITGPPSGDGSLRPCAIGAGADRFVGSGVLLSTLTDILARPAGRPVIDRTGLPGRFDIQLQWAASPDSDAASIFTAVQEQLGLKLQADIAPLDVVVINEVSPPSEN